MTRRILGEVAGAVLAADVDLNGTRTSLILDTGKATRRVHVEYDVSGAKRMFDSRAGTLTRVEAIKSAERLAKKTELIRRPEDGRVVEIETGPVWRLVEI